MDVSITGRIQSTTTTKPNSKHPTPPKHQQTTEPGTIVCWNVAMEAATGRAAGTVLYAKADRCGAFTKEGAAAIREAMVKATVRWIGGGCCVYARPYNVFV